MVRVNSIDDMGVLCSLLEYNNLEGFLPLSEISRKRMRSVLRHVRVGQQQVLQVLRVDTERGYTDLSKKYIAEAERELGTEKYNKGKTVHNITKRVSETTHKDLEDIYRVYVWPLYANAASGNSAYKHPYDAFKAVAACKEGEEEDIWEGFVDVQPEVRKAFLGLIKHQMAVQPVKVGAQIELMCYSEGGIDDIKRALKAGLDLNNGQLTAVKIQLISSPLYLVWTTTLEEDKGYKCLNEVIDVIKQAITDFGGVLTVAKEPSVIGKVDA
uniref:S1 motif domain-containing protein n=1 Tax=Arcella intermedia TaxID=1963864 RepID=A0A6B2LD48_9EUKA